MPFVTEELWQAGGAAARHGRRQHLAAAYPRAGDIDAADFAQAEADIEWLKTMVSALRRVRSELGVSPAQAGHAAGAWRRLRTIATRSDTLRCRSCASCASWNASTALAERTARPPHRPWSGNCKLFVPLEGLVDLDAERARLDKEIAQGRVRKGQERSQAGEVRRQRAGGGGRTGTRAPGRLDRETRSTHRAAHPLWAERGAKSDKAEGGGS